MATASEEALRAIFEQIRDERKTHANTATRIGDAFLSLLSHLDNGTFLKQGDTESTEYILSVTGGASASLTKLFTLETVTEQGEERVTLATPLAPFKELELRDYLQIGDARLRWDSERQALYVIGKDGSTPVGFYSTGWISALGANDSEGEGGGGGLAYSRLDTWEGYTEPDMEGWVLSAKLANDMYQDIKELKQGAAISYVTQGTGNAVTDVTKLNGQLVFTKGKTFSELWHTHPLADIYNLHSSWDAILKVAPSAYVTRWPTAAEVGALTQTAADSRYALKTVTITAGAGLSGGGNLSANRTLSLAAVGTAGTYTKVTVDAYGRVTAHASLSATDIPTLSISKISGLQAALDKKLEATAFTELFEKVTLADGTTAIRAKYGLFSDEFLSAKGANDSEGEGGGGGIAYSRLDTWEGYTEPDMEGWVLSAKLANDMYQDIKELKAGAAISYVTQGTGNAVTDVTKLNGQLVFTRGKTFSELGHTHPLADVYNLHSSWDAVLKAQKPNWLTAVSLATISDLHANWDAILKVAPSAYVTRWPTAAEVGALTQSAADSRYALKTVTISAGAGLTGGGNLSANRTLSLAAVGTAGTYTKVTVDAYGRVTAHASLSATDIPSLSISKINGLQAALDKKLEATAFTELFEKVTLADGTTAIRAKYGLYTDSFLSAKGANPEAGTLPVGATSLDELEDVTIDRPVSGQTLVYDGTKWRNQEAKGGLDEDELSAWLTNHQYALKGDITIALSGYATEEWVEGRGYLTEADLPSLSGYATQTWVKQQGYLTSASLSGYATQSWVTQKLASYYTSAQMDTLLGGKVDKEDGKGLSSNDFTDALLAKLNGIAAGANKYTLPTASATTLGGVKVGATLAIASSVLNLKAVGTAGTYTKVTTDAYGRVTAGEKLAASDIPALDWSKITSGKPTTLSGYGITDGVTTPAYTGSGNVLTAATISGHTITFTKGITAALASRKVTAGKGLTGGGTLTADITLNVASANAGISVNADNIQLNTVNALTSTDTVKPLSAAQGKKIWDFVTDLFEKVNIGTSSAPVYAIRAKYGLFSDEFLSAKGANDSQGEGGGGAAYNRLDTWDGYSEALAGWVLSAGLGYSLYNDVNSLKQGAAVSLVTTGSGNAVTDIAKSGTKLTVTKGLSFLTSHQNIFSLTIQGNGTSLGKYTPNSAAKTINITPASIGAATSGHTHSQYLTAVSLATISDLHSSWDAVLKAQKPNWLTSVSLATISDLHSSWDAVLKAQKPNWLTAHQAIYALTLQGNGSTIGTYNPKSAAATINLTAETLRLARGRVSPQTGRTQNYGWLYSYNCNASTTGDRPANYMSVVGFGMGTGGTVEIGGCWISSMGLWYRALRDYEDDWYEWRKLLDSVTYTEYTVTKTGGGASGTWGIGISGNAATASKWAAKRTISLTGAVTGSVSLDGSGNVSMATTYAAANISALDSRYLLKSAYTAADVLAKLKTVDGSGSGLDADTLDGTQLVSLMRCDGANGIALTGGNGNTEGYRLVIQKTMTAWSINNLVFVVASRHNGQGVMSIGFHVTADKVSSYAYSIKFYGAKLANDTAPWRAFYNASTGVFRLYWHYLDYTKCGINVLRNEGFPAPSNGTWYETLPSDNGTELGISYNDADTLGGTAKSGLLTALSSSTGTNLSLTVGGTTKTVADLYATYAERLLTARTINGTSFNGTANIVTSYWGTARNLCIQDATAAHTGAAVSVNGSANAYLKLPATITATLSGNASSASKLQTARTLWGQSFNGTANVSGSLSGVGSISASGNFSTSKATNTYLAGNQGQALVNSTASAGSYVMLHRGCSTNGYFTLGTYQGTYLLQYTAKSTVTAGTNSVTKSVTLLNEAGNSSFPGSLYAKTGLYSDGYVSAKGQNTSSDMRLKRVLGDISLPLERIAKAPSFEFRWRDGSGESAGSSAQYWRGVLPQAVNERGGYLEMQYGNIALLSAISIARETMRIDRRVARLEEENRRLRRRVKTLEGRRGHGI